VSEATHWRVNMADKTTKARFWPWLSAKVLKTSEGVLSWLNSKRGLGGGAVASYIKRLLDQKLRAMKFTTQHVLY